MLSVCIPAVFTNMHGFVVTLSTVLICWCLYKISFQLFFHRLSVFPGPRLAAISTWWLCYQEIALGRSLYDVLVDLHRTYGPVVRYGPNQLHFSIPDAYHDIYNQTSKWDKDPFVYTPVAENTSMFGMVRFNAAKERREILQPFFAKRNVLQMQSLVLEQVQILTQRLLQQGNKGDISNLTFGFRCLAQDVVSSIVIGESYHCLDSEDFQSPFLDALECSLPVYPFEKHFPLLTAFRYMLQTWISSYHEDALRAQDVAIVKHVRNAAKAATRKAHEAENLCDFMLARKASNPDITLDLEAITAEIQIFMAGGGETVASALTLGFHSLLQHPGLYQAAHEEIVAVWPIQSITPVAYESLEKLPLLTGVIKESLRFSHGVVAPLARIVPPQGAHIAGYFVPGGTSVGESNVFVHRNPKLFENPEEFDPYRWTNQHSIELNKWLVAFAKGPRTCTGVHIAWCELYIAFAALLRACKMEWIPELNDERVKFKDCFQALYTSKHLQVRCRTWDV